MSSENVITLVAAILALFASLIAIYNTNFKRFARERWWERKAKAYEDVVVSLSDLIHYYRTLMDQELQLRSPSKGKMEEIGKRQQDMGAFMISVEASAILHAFWKEPNKNIDPQDWYSRFEANFVQADNCLNKITTCAKRDLHL
jgi:hypothetical protein